MASVQTSSNRPYHLVIFGASGFTGQFVVEEVARTASEGPKGNLKWAVAGRSRQKLEQVLEQAASVLEKPELRTQVDIIVADVDEPDSLTAMCKQAVIVLNCVGPYRFFGEPVVKACVENGAHHLDISGEPQFLEGMQLNYHDMAAEKGVYIVGSCGFDSIPADMGVLYTREQFKGTLTALESFLTVNTGPEGGVIHDGTWQSAIYGFADSDKLQSLRRKFNYKPLPSLGTKLQRRGALFYSNEVQQYTVPFMGSDPSVVKRTQRFLVEEYQDTPVQYGAYAGIGGIGSVIKLMFAGMMFWLLVKFTFGRNLLVKHPEFFSFGLFSKAGPTRKQMESSSFRFAFYGEGYTEGLDPTQGKPNGKICTLVQGPECGYVATPIALVQAALTILNEPKALPKSGGVYTPGAVFAKTTLIKRLDKHGIQFSVI
ncbi:saccharopine dehydrogenase-like oxidoreductase isoform X2 [Syngnathus acus]|uniref:saccharopine dehydrogenase-like oxidoreductase isoform X1 n=1 Tax=Syngnathus acus TaxID=161584 RepID=UPI001885CCBB|nr:saccharopine dehydrogenase-like oxidoreductase isoform X1 [Syngnathus acus]XP_037103609.1 saccharopine dehydrogenase-like oxidoreductase isoform X2 [Syngnathus acus]